MPSIRTNDDNSDALSMRTLTESTLTPSDGYFTSRDHPSQVLHTEEPEIAKKEILRSTSPSQSSFFSSPPLSAQWTPDSSSEFSVETSALLGRSTPPPDYSSTRNSIRPNYMVEPPRWAAREDYRQASAPQIPLQNMRDGDGFDPIRQRLRAKREHFRRVLGKVARLGMTVCIIVILIGYLRSRNQPSVTFPSPKPRLPPWVQDCPDTNYLEHHELNNLTNFFLSDARPGSFSGTIKLLPALPSQTTDLTIKLRPGISSRLLFNAQKITSKSSIGSTQSFRSSSCTPADVTLHFRHDLILQNLGIRTQSGKILIHAPQLQVENSTTLSTATGAMDTGTFANSRKTYIDTASSSLKGVYPLYDVLSITSTSGTVDITLDPKPASSDNPKPAKLIIISQSGSVKINTLSTDVPDRKYIAVVSSNSGSISGSLIHGHSTTVSTQSSSIDLTILPHASTSEKKASSSLTTTSRSGSHKVRLLSPAGNLGSIKSTHIVESGHLGINYPAEWEGKIHGSTESGSMNLHGDGVRVIESGSHGGGKYVVAEKGDAETGKLVFRSNSGSADVNIGF